MDVHQVIGAARAEADRMRAAVAGAEDGAKVNMGVRQFTKLAELITALCDLAAVRDRAAVRRPHFKPLATMPMEGDDPMQSARTLAQIESDMLAAEDAYAEAEARFLQARRDRDAALAAINQHQAELDEAVARLRERSPAASTWKGQAESRRDVLMLDHEDSSPSEAALFRGTAMPAVPWSQALPETDDAAEAADEERVGEDRAGEDRAGEDRQAGSL